MGFVQGTEEFGPSSEDITRQINELLKKTVVEADAEAALRGAAPVVQMRILQKMKGHKKPRAALIAHLHMELEYTHGAGTPRWPHAPLRDEGRLLSLFANVCHYIWMRKGSGLRETTFT